MRLIPIAIIATAFFIFSFASQVSLKESIQLQTQYDTYDMATNALWLNRFLTFGEIPKKWERGISESSLCSVKENE